MWWTGEEVAATGTLFKVGIPTALETHAEGRMHWKKFIPEIHWVPENIKILLFVSKLLNERRNCSSFTKPPILGFF